ncbi:MULTISPECIES: GerMN domain-containing protein [Clostridia]|uniref:GerMN domain-containing protein n=1 Tax=Clostridia TaxID=186801 RepID=UPI000E4B3473|nr:MULTISPECIES: GerMN domain-containing protein [Clostridia]RGH41832.1 sporulation protein [Firmicutes bacterium AM41-5BH]RHV07285.1 sporulation protein [Firmicutes bacterium OM07-11]RKQ31879.1 sporulation protein [Ruminococcus sp. B05]TAP36119.1 sporulation protein [Mediterraneibacter sp. gm002]
MKKGKLIIIGLVVMALISGCGKTADSKENKANSTEQTKDIETEQNKDVQMEENADKQEGEEQQIPDEQNVSAQTGGNIKVYYSNSDASGFESEEVAIGSLSSNEVLKALVDKGVLPVDVSLLSFKEFEKDNEKLLELDFSDKFITYIKTLGTSAEYYIVGSICNTFLDAYGSDKIHITVNGDVFTTGHAEYPGYMGKFN